MGNVQSLPSKATRKFKQWLARRKSRPDGTEANPGGGADPTTSHLQPEPHVVVDESRDREGNRDDTAGERATSTDRSPQPDGVESVPAYGNDNGREEGETEIDGGEPSQRGSSPYSDVEVTVRSGSDGIYPSPSTPSISDSEEPDGM